MEAQPCCLAVLKFSAQFNPFSGSMKGMVGVGVRAASPVSPSASVFSQGAKGNVMFRKKG